MREVYHEGERRSRVARHFEGVQLGEAVEYAVRQRPDGVVREVQGGEPGGQACRDGGQRVARRLMLVRVGSWAKVPLGNAERELPDRSRAVMDGSWLAVVVVVSLVVSTGK